MKKNNKQDDGKKYLDTMYLVQITLLIFLIAFYVMSLFEPKLEIVFRFLLAAILVVIGINGRKKNAKVVTYLYYFAGFCALINMIVGIIYG